MTGAAGSAWPDRHGGTGAVLFGAIAGVGMTGAALGVVGRAAAARAADGLGLLAVVLLGGLLARMVADGVPALAWLHWLTPFGLIGRTAPYAGDRVPPLVVLVAAWRSLAVRRGPRSAGTDVGSGRCATGRCAGPEPAARLAAGLAGHRARRPTRGWGTGRGAYFLLIGLLATAMIDFLRDNPASPSWRRPGSPSWQRSRATSPRCSRCSRSRSAPSLRPVAAAAADEAAGRLPRCCLCRSRGRWAATRREQSPSGCVVLACVAGLATWAGSAWVGRRLGLWGEARCADPVASSPSRCLGLGARPALALGWVPQARLALGGPAGGRRLSPAGLRRLLALAGVGPGCRRSPTAPRAGRADGRRGAAGHGGSPGAHLGRRRRADRRPSRERYEM